MHQSVSDLPLLLIGSFLLAGYVAHTVGNRTHLPRVILLLLVGIIGGPSVLNLVPAEAAQWFPVASQAALSVIGFELGEKFLGSRLKHIGRALFIISLVKVLGTALLVLLVLLLLGFPPVVALILAGIAPATAPATTADVIYEAKASGELTDTTLRLVAIDDAWGIILFSLLLAVAATASGENGTLVLLLSGLREIFGAILLGVLLGLPMAMITGRVSEGELTLIEALGFVFVCGGLAAAFGLSSILACMAMGCTVSNLARHHSRPFHAIENVRQPFLIIFFLLAGYHADLEALAALGALSLAYILARSCGVIGACALGAQLAGLPARVRNHVGFCMLPQAGVALGLALLASERFPDYGGQVLSIIVGTSVLFEIVGPLVTRAALRHAGEVTA